ncbi:SDR family oxidoreductase [Marinobacter salinexigens]|uniref:SDR family oxidoreductase n=1 Tax=Marinobacter salinexigens TaxID=2919747 RepID=A0A5B0VHZ7_9GAMM|nr:SDR family oxidoreductase [Marinobacter salinexigens]KAA1174330.1 SDR family oxidoreductase [Marinobacter salinexigens]
MKLKDSVALITGSSSGIGAATARLFAEHGCHVVINYSSNEAGARAVAAECEQQGVRALVVQANVADDADCRALVAATLAHFGRLDILINNAGTTKFCDHANLDGLNKQDFLDLYSVNTVGPFQMTRAAEKALRANGSGHVINMASIAGLAGIGSSIAYAASKGALVTMTRSLARVMGPEVRVNAVCPGFVQGEWLKNGLGDDRYNTLLEKNKAAAPLNDTASPETVADVCLGLIIGGDLTTGETILIDGGAHLGAAPVRR